ncbi:MAG: tRNA (N6-threonylcarbamoyladenosine(37)-N6)-methyltransferase TrmO [Candidatus Methanomethyliaceae archaeon]|nr:tRNA (N6-threonylcarbamoyladenosine(37)-N6)-methyltransferase TrmO [Candidatus Methanomethyliaceae archaeon]MDW7970776.1 tRNA (N6-threonylcarbamoyladenosine(37)-N6)-methyltransferase TrmO [Nitrososphaerota archaeon]
MEILKEYIDGIRGLNGFSHIIIIAYLHRVSEIERRTLLVKPRRFAKLGIPIDSIPTVGVFCTDSPHRPNPIAITIARLLKIEGNKLYVDDVDLFHETPIIDIKPYTESRIIHNLKYPEWYSNLIEQIKLRTGRILEP